MLCLPGSAPTYKIPDSIEDKAIRRYQYMVIDNRMVLVDPSSRKIIADGYRRHRQPARVLSLFSSTNGPSRRAASST